MGESDRYQEYKKLKKTRFSLGQDGNALMALFTINVIFFLVLLTVQVAYFFYQQTNEAYYTEVVRWFELPASISKFSHKPWTLLTYMFSDTGFSLIRIATNMIWLWAFGYVLQEMTGNDKIIPVYIYGGLLGGIAFIAAGNFIPPVRNQVETAALLGANASTMAVAMATTTLSPNHKFFTMIRGGIPIWLLMLAFLIIDLAGVSNLNAAYSISHIAGAAAGFLFVLFMKNGIDGSVWMNRLYDWFMNLFNPHKKRNQGSVRNKVFYNTGNRSPYSKQAIITQQRIDEILDKINQRGYQFLTDEEKQILKKASEEDI